MLIMGDETTISCFNNRGHDTVNPTVRKLFRVFTLCMGMTLFSSTMDIFGAPILDWLRSSARVIQQMILLHNLI